MCSQYTQTYLSRCHVEFDAGNKQVSLLLTKVCQFLVDLVQFLHLSLHIVYGLLCV
jgi:hypothetical protein